MKIVKSLISFLVTVSLAFASLPTVRASHTVPIDCVSPSGTGRSGMRVPLQPASLYHLNPYVLEAEADVNTGVFNCTWIFTVTGNIGSSRDAVTAVFELQRKGGAQVMAGDAFSNLSISVYENGTSTTHWFRPNLTLLPVKSGSIVTVSASAVHSGVSGDDALFIRMFLVSGESCPSDRELFHKYGDSCITVRPAKFICGANRHLRTCSMMANLVIQTSADELMELVRNVSLNKEFSRYLLSSTTLISGILCKRGTLMTCAARTAGSAPGRSCSWRPIPGKLTGISRKCRATSVLQYIIVRVTGNGKLDLDLVGSEEASQLPVLLDMRLTADHETEEPVPNVASGHLMIEILVGVLTAIIALVLVTLAGVIGYKLYTKFRIRDTNTRNPHVLENRGIGGQREQVNLINAR